MSATGNSTAPARYCTNCGNAVQSGARFCTNCGVAVASAEPKTTTPSRTDAEKLFVDALKLGLAEGSSIPAIPLLHQALAIGLSPKDEVPAHLMLGEGYREIFGNSGLTWREMVASREFQQCMVEIEKPLR